MKMARAPLSIVIPTLNAEAALRPCLLALMEGVEAGLVRELVVSDGVSTDGTAALVEAVGAKLVTGPAGRGGQLGRGVAASSGDWLLMLHADTVLGPGWVDAVERAIAAGAPGYFRLRFHDGGRAGRLVAGWANLRARAFGLAFGDQGLLVSRAEYLAAGGYPDVALMEDMALVRALPRLTALDAVAETSAARYRARGWLRQGAGNLVRQARFLMGADPSRLLRGYDAD